MDQVGDSIATDYELAKFAEKLRKRIVSMCGRRWSTVDGQPHEGAPDPTGPVSHQPPSPLERLDELLRAVPEAAAGRDRHALGVIYRALNELDATVARGLPEQRPQDTPDPAWPELRVNLALESLKPLIIGDPSQDPPAQERKKWWKRW